MNRKKIYPLSLTFRVLVMLSIVIMLCFVVPVSAVSDTVTVYTTNVSDGRVARTGVNATFSDLRLGQGTDGYSTGNYSLARISSDTGTNGYNDTVRGVLIFNTSVLPDDATITSAKIGIYTYERSVGLGDTGLSITKFSINGTINSADYQNFNDTRFADDQSISTMLSSFQYHNFTLNALGRSNISLTGDSGFGVRTAFDIDNTPPTWASNVATYIRFNSADNGTYIPFIEISYTNTTSPVVTGISPATGPLAGGTSVIITGTDLGSAISVNFSASTATITANTATSITATSPAGTGTVHVTVTTAGGTSATGSADQFTYAAAAVPFGIGVYRPSAHMFYLKNGTALSWTTTAINWGASTDLPVTGDWNGDGITDIGVYRPSSHMFYLKNGTALSWTTTAINWGASTDKPVTGKWG